MRMFEGDVSGLAVIMLKNSCRCNREYLQRKIFTITKYIKYYLRNLAGIYTISEIIHYISAISTKRNVSRITIIKILMERNDSDFSY